MGTSVQFSSVRTSWLFAKMKVAALVLLFAIGLAVSETEFEETSWDVEEGSGSTEAPPTTEPATEPTTRRPRPTRPTPPHFVKCLKELNRCLFRASGWRQIQRCHRRMERCLNGRAGDEETEMADFDEEGSGEPTEAPTMAPTTTATTKAPKTKKPKTTRKPRTTSAPTEAPTTARPEIRKCMRQLYFCLRHAGLNMRKRFRCYMQMKKCVFGQQ